MVEQRGDTRHEGWSRAQGSDAREQETSPSAKCRRSCEPEVISTCRVRPRPRARYGSTGPTLEGRHYLRNKIENSIKKTRLQ
jgi:hypothetical protein